MTLVAAIGGARIGVVHGDAELLAGWHFAHDGLDAVAARSWLERVRDASRIDVFASTHTCLPILRDFSTYDSYFHRLVDGPAFSLDDAVKRVGEGATMVRELTP